MEQYRCAWRGRIAWSTPAAPAGGGRGRFNAPPRAAWRRRRSGDGMDGISISVPTTICELHDGALRTYRVMPEELGLGRAGPAAVKGGTADENAALMHRLLEGTASEPLRDVVVLNAAAAFIAC